MAGSIGRSISIGLAVNTKNFAKGLKDSEKRLEKFKKGVQVAGAAISAAFAAIAGAALVFGKNAVTAALEDQKAMQQLAKTVKNNTKVTKDYQHTVEKSVTALQDQYNVADDKIRPAFNKLIIATKSVSKSQKLMRIAMDVSAATGKDLNTVTAAISRAYLGNNTALGKLGIGIDKATLKNKSFDDIMKQVAKTTGGAAATAANTYAGQVEGLKIAWNEFQESVGYKILPKLKDMLTYIKKDLLPWLGEIKKGFTGAPQETISPQLRKVSKAMGLNPDQPKSSAYGLGESLKKMADAFSDLFESLSSDKAGSAGSTLDQIAGSMATVANAITSVTKAISGTKSWWKNFTGANGNSVFGPDRVFNPKTRKWEFPARATGGPVTRNQSYLVGERGPELFTPSGSGSISTNRQTMGAPTYNISLNGVLDADSARRSIEYVLRNSGKRLGGVDLVGSTL